MSTDVVIVGAGGFGRDVLDVIWEHNRAAGTVDLNVVGFLDDSPTEANLKLLAQRGVAYLGATASWLTHAPAGTGYLIAVGVPAVRRRLDERLSASGLSPVAAVHPTAVLGTNVELGPGTIVFAGVLVKNEIVLGRHVHLNMGATVGHDAVIGDFVTVNPRASISGNCTVEDEVMVGAGAVVLQGRTVHTGASVGGLACVTRDVPAGTTVKGVPAR